MKFVTLPSGRIIDIDKLAFLGPPAETKPGLRFSFGANYAEFGIDDALAVLEAMEEGGVDTKEVRKKAGLPAKS